MKRLGAALVLGALSFPVLAELRITRAVRPLTDEWRRLLVEPRGDTLMGVSWRTPQVAALGLEPQSSFERLLAYPFQMVRLGAYWQRIEPQPGHFIPDELDAQIDAAERAGKHIILCVGALKTFGYPEFFVPAHRLPRPLPEGRLVRPADHAELLAAATEFIQRIVERYRDRQAIVAWQVEHEAVDPLGLEHSWRLAEEWIMRELETVKRADAAGRRPIVLNAFLPTSIMVALQQWWRTRDQGDSLVVARRRADIIGLDVYPRNALVSLGPLTAYLDGFSKPWQRRTRARTLGQSGSLVMVTESQAEPWETVVQPPDPHRAVMFSCPPEQLIATYNSLMREARQAQRTLYGYLFWGAEYWLLRDEGGDASYLGAFERIIRES